MTGRPLPMLSGAPPEADVRLPQGAGHDTSVSSYRVQIQTFGCQMNEYDTELVRALLKARGFSLTDHQDEADVILLNTCAIRENAHSKVYSHLATLRRLKQQRRLVVGVLGCMAQNLKKELTRNEPLIDVLVGPDGYRSLPTLVTRALTTQERGTAVELSEYETYRDILPERADGVNGWIAIMRGCDNFCTFCVVPYTRGRERSRDPEGILEEAEHLAAQGYKQITLLGQNVNSYRYGAWDFARLLTAVADIPGISRVRFTSPHPKDFPPPVLEAVAGHPRICKHIHLPLQSGNDRILELMNRSYTGREYLDLVTDIRRHGGIALSTDIICGFSSETEEDFLDTYHLVEEIGFHSAFIFKYSERKHTIAARKYPDDVPESVKSDRVTRLVERQKSISLAKNRAVIGRTVDVLVEGHAKKSDQQWMGKSDSNVTVVWPKGAGCLAPGDLVSVSINDASPTTLYGTLAPD